MSDEPQPRSAEELVFSPLALRLVTCSLCGCLLDPELELATCRQCAEWRRQEREMPRER